MCYFVEDYFRGNNFRKTPPPLLANSTSLTHSLTHYLTHPPPTHSLTRTQSHTHLTHSIPPTHPLTPSPDPTPPHPTRGNNFRKTLPPLLANSTSLTHSLSHPPIPHPLTHSLTHSNPVTHPPHSLHPTHSSTNSFPRPLPTPPIPHPHPSTPHPTPPHTTYCSHFPSLPFSITLPHAPPSIPPPSSLSPSILFTHSLTPPHPPHLTPPHLVFLKLFLRLLVVLSSSPLKILEGFCCAIHSNRIHVLRNDIICVIEECLFCLYNGRKTDRIWNYIFQLGQSSMLAIGPGKLCLVKIYIYEKNLFDLKRYGTKWARLKFLTFHRVIV